MLDNVEEFYNSKTNAGKWAKAANKGHDVIFAMKMTTSSQTETHDCYNCREKGGTSKSHISPQYPYPHKANSGRGQGCGGQGRGHGGGKNGAERKTQQPKSGESHVKVINRVNHTWCGWYADFKPNHGMKDNAEKCLHYKPNSHSGCLRAAHAAAQAAVSGTTTPAVA
eukprot:13224933-Ditylum_brightwellii.AAC.1